MMDVVDAGDLVFLDVEGDDGAIPAQHGDNRERSPAPNRGLRSRTFLFRQRHRKPDKAHLAGATHTD